MLDWAVPGQGMPRHPEVVAEGPKSGRDCGDALARAAVRQT